MYRDIDSIPVLAPEGAIIPMYRSADSNDLSLAQPLDIHIWRGNGSYQLYEDDGETMGYQQGEFALTSFELEENDGCLRLVITPPKDSHGLLPREREIFIKFRDIDAEERRVILADKPVTVEITDIRPRKTATKEDLKSALLTRAQGSNDKKSILFATKLPAYLAQALKELDAMIF